MELFTANLGHYLNTSLFLSLGAAYLGGILTSFTPCVYPLIPITASYITSKSLKSKSRLQTFILSFLYVSGMAMVYAGLGLFAALSGKIFGEVSTNPIAYLVIGNIMIVMGLSMFDIFYLKLPAFLSGFSARQKKKGFIGVFIIGMASGLVVAPCTAPVLGVLLAYVSATGNSLKGGFLLFVFAFGMGTLLIVIGTFSGIISMLPKSGEWMNKIKKIIAVTMLLAGEYFIFQAGALWL